MMIASVRRLGLGGAAAVLCLCAPVAATAGDLAKAAPGSGCHTPESRQFDFWIGRWTVYDRLNKSPGKSVIESVYGGCGVHETWTEEALVGGSISAFDPIDKRWRQLWVDSTGGVREFVGSLDPAGRMVLIARYPSGQKPGATVLDRMTYSAEPGGAVRQYSDASIDGGATWKPLYDNLYAREP